MEAGNKAGKARFADQAAIRGLVCEIVARVCRQQLAQSLRSLLLTGSLAREEATVLPHPGGCRMLGDADFIAVFERHAPLPAAGAVAALTAQCESALRAAGVIAHVGMAVVYDDYFRRLPAHILTYELRCCGRIVCGDETSLALIPRFPASAIDKEDAWRLLANRTIECLELSRVRSPAPVQANANLPSDDLHYRTVKLFLDMATSLLVFVDAYEPTYAQRAQKLTQLAERLPEQARPPFAMRVFAGCVDQCTRWKLAPRGDGIPNKDGVGLLGCNGRTADSEIAREAFDYACRLWRWELAQLTSTGPEASPETLFADMAARQSAWQKFRGWLYVARRTGWLRSVRAWPRWMRMAFDRTPRYYVYEAAWRLAVNDDCPLDQADIRRIRALLPVAGRDDQGVAAPREQLIRELVWNYQTFLMETRA